MHSAGVVLEQAHPTLSSDLKTERSKSVEAVPRPDAKNQSDRFGMVTLYEQSFLLDMVVLERSELIHKQYSQ